MRFPDTQQPFLSPDAVPGGPPSVPEVQSSAQLLDQANKQLGSLEDRETYGDYFHNMRNEIVALIEKAKTIARTPEELERVSKFEKEYNWRIELLLTWGLGVKPAVLGGDRDFVKLLNVPIDDIITPSTIGHLINDETTFNRREEVVVQSGFRAARFPNEIRYTKTAVGELMRLFDKVMRGAIKIPVAIGSSTLVGPENIQANLGTLQQYALDRFQGWDITPKTVQLAYRLWWTTTFHPSYLGKNPENIELNKTPTLPDWFYKAYRLNAYQLNYINTARDNFMPDLTFLLFGIRGQGCRLSEREQRDIRKKMETHGYLREYGWLLGEPLAARGLLHTQMDIENPGPGESPLTGPDYGYCIKPPLAYFDAERDGSRKSFYSWENVETGDLIYEAMPFNEIPSQEYGAYVQKLAGAAVRLIKELFYGNPNDITAKMASEVTYADWTKWINDGISLIRKIGNTRDLELLENKKRLQLIIMLAGTIYKTVRAEYKGKWKNETDVEGPLIAAVKAGFITLEDKEMIMLCFVPVISLFFEGLSEMVTTSLKHSTGSGSGGGAGKN